MAINNGRYVVTGGYITPDGNIVEETQYIPEKTYSVDHIMDQMNSLVTGQKTPEQIRAEDGIYKTTPTYSNYFPSADAYALQSQGYYGAGNDAMGKVYGDIASNLGKYSTFAQSSVDTADALLNYLQGNEANLQKTAGNLYNQLVGDIQSQRNYINQMFGPDGQLTKEVNQYYDDLGNYLATEAGRQAANIAAQGVHSGASLGSIRAQQNEAYNEAFSRYVQAKEQEINAKQQIAANLINYMSTLRKEYGDTTNQYIIELYKRANDMYNNVAQSVAADLDQYNALRAQGTGGGGGGSSTADILNSIFGQQGTSSTGTQGTGTSTVVTEPANQGTTATTGTTAPAGTGTSGTGRTTPNYLGAALAILNPFAYGTMQLGNYLGNQLRK